MVTVAVGTETPGPLRVCNEELISYETRGKLASYHIVRVGVGSWELTVKMSTSRK